MKNNIAVLYPRPVKNRKFLAEIDVNKIKILCQMVSKDLP